LSNYGQSLTSAEIRQAITDPKARNSSSKTASALTRDGKKVSGVVRNEDNFSIQLQTADGQFHFFDKAELTNLQYETGGMMPSDYGEKLSTKDLDDLANFLHTVKSQSGPRSIAADDE
jgi:cytochrome c oxidase cbb3-type subunit III